MRLMEGGGGVETLHKNRGNEFIGRDMGFDKKSSEHFCLLALQWV